MATNIIVRVFLFCFFAMSADVVAQQPADNPAGANGGVARAGVNGTGTPQCIYCPPPSYTKKARTAKRQGTVLLDVTVTTDGKIIDPKSDQGSRTGIDRKGVNTNKEMEDEARAWARWKTSRLPGANRSHFPLVLADGGRQEALGVDCIVQQSGIRAE